MSLLLSSSCSDFRNYDLASTQTAQSERSRQLATKAASAIIPSLTARVHAAQATAEALEQIRQLAHSLHIVLDDTFDTPNNGWPENERDDPLANIQWDFIDGKYRWAAQAKEGFVWWATPEIDDVDDFSASISITQLEGPADAEYGMIFRRTSDGEYYLFELREAGEYALFLFWQDNWWTLIDWMPIDTFQTGTENRIDILALDDIYYFYINDTLVDQYQDQRLPLGQVGLLVGLSNGGDEGVWDIDNFTLRTPP
jgi:hypothetical protein